ncbi:hypothetical protein IFM89_028932 [Coptis chinensis]|uniref:Uncharacterized protein n=1 Tax=Coptis chinensis TaxID=261450 RepID=A0A835H679_9MAGN|nr:hypothetical protein IFM89_028932 [Coptis chinensis]
MTLRCSVRKVEQGASCEFSFQMASYYDIDDIIMEDEVLVPVFQIVANGVGMLDPGAERNCVCLERNTDWRSGWTRKEIQADVACVDLKSRCSYFYELGCKVAPLFALMAKPECPAKNWKGHGRYKEVLSKAHSAAFIMAPKFLTLLTKEETQLYEAARSSMTAFKKWRVGGPRFERASILRKRKPTD